MAPHRTIPQRLSDHDEWLADLAARVFRLENLVAEQPEPPPSKAPKNPPKVEP